MPLRGNYLKHPRCESLFIAPGNAGTSKFGTNLNIGITDFDSIRKACIDEKIDMVVVGPEEPLVKGVTDFLISSAALKNLDVIDVMAIYSDHTKAGRLLGWEPKMTIDDIVSTAWTWEKYRSAAGKS